ARLRGRGRAPGARVRWVLVASAIATRRDTSPPRRPRERRAPSLSPLTRGEGPWRLLLRGRHRAGHAGAAEAAIAVGILRQVLLVIILGVVEGRRIGDLGGGRAAYKTRERLLKGITRGLGAATLLGARGIDRRAVLRADVVALAHALGRVVALPEGLEQRVVADDARIEDDQHGLGMAGEAGADFLIGGVGRVAAGIAHRGGVDAGQAPEAALGAPEAAEAEDRRLEPGRERRLQRMPVDEMRLGHRHLRRASLERVFRRRHRRLLAHPHGSPPWSAAPLPES